MHSPLRGQTVLVTGASGFIGRPVCAALLRAGARVHGTGRTRPPPDGVQPHELAHAEQIEAIVDAAQPEVLIHLASPIDLGQSATLYASLRPGVLDLSVAVASACERRGLRLIHVGTCAEYGDAPVPLSEQVRPRPVSPYGALKLAASAWVMGRVRAGALRASVLRPFRAYGPGDQHSVIAQACRAALRGQGFAMSDGAQVREWNTVAAVARGIVSAAADPRADGQVLNIGGGPRASVLEVVQRVFALAGADPQHIQAGALPRRPGEPQDFWGDHARTRALWGAPPPDPLDAGLRRALAWQDGQR